MKYKSIETGLSGVVVKEASVVDTGEKRLHVYSEYNPAFVSEARKLNGRFLSDKKAWSFDYRDKDRVLEALRNVYGEDGATKTVTVDVNVYLDNIRFGQSLFLFGRQLLHTWGRDSKVIYGDGVTVLEGYVSSGGSRKNPSLNAGKGTVLLVRDVPETLLSKAPADVWKLHNEKPKGETLINFDAPPAPKNTFIDLISIEFEMAIAIAQAEMEL